MKREKFGVAVTPKVVGELDKLVKECADLGASRLGIVEAILTAYLQSDVDHVTRMRELIFRRRQTISNRL